MTDKINLNEMEKQANKLLSQDGLIELFLGAILFITSSTFSESTAFTPFLGLYVIFTRTIIEVFRKRITYPRIGYLKLQEEDMKKVGRGILTFVGVIMLGLVVFMYLIFGDMNSELVYQWIPVVMGLILFGGLYYNYEKTGDRSNLIYITIAIVGGLVFSFLDFGSPKEGPQIYLLIMSSVFIVAGLIRLYRFIQKYPVKYVDERGQIDE